MTDDNINKQDDRIIYLYRVTCVVNQKIYIGQTVDPNSRWRAHRRDAADPKVPFHYAIKKYGNENFIFEVIATCKGQNNANELETTLVKQYDSYVSNNGYNASHGGMNAPKSEEWKQLISKLARDRAPLTSQQMTAIAAARPLEYYDYVKGNKYAEGMIHTDEWKEQMSNRIQSEEEKQVRSASLKKAYAEGRKISPTKGKEPWNKGIPISDETKQKMSESLKGRVAPNKTLFTDEQIAAILSDTRSCQAIGQDYNVSLDVIWRLKKKHSANRNIKESSKDRQVLTDQQIEAMRQEYLADPKRGKQTQLAKKYGISQQYCNRLLNGLVRK